MKFLLCCLYCLSCGAIVGQTTPIAIRNPSFEDLPGPGRAPHGWYFCNFPGESPPDIHPIVFLGVETLPKSGDTFVGLVTRPNGSYERIGQHLQQPLQAGTRYRLRVHVARSPHYNSLDRETLLPVDFNNPVIVQLLGSRMSCTQNELLAQSEPIVGNAWQEITFEFEPRTNLEYLIIGAYFTDSETPLPGHVLIDHLGPILPQDDLAPRAFIDEANVPILPSREQLLDWTRGSLGPSINKQLLDPRAPVRVFRDKHGHLLQGAPIIYQLWEVLEQPNQLRLEVGLRVRDQEAFRHLRASFMLLALEIGKKLDRIEFKRLKPGGTSKKWDYAAPDQLIWLRWR